MCGGTEEGGGHAQGTGRPLHSNPDSATRWAWPGTQNQTLLQRSPQSCSQDLGAHVHQLGPCPAHSGCSVEVLSLLLGRTSDNQEAGHRHGGKHGRDVLAQLSGVLGHRRATRRWGQGSRSQKSFTVACVAVESLQVSGSWWDKNKWKVSPTSVLTPVCWAVFACVMNTAGQRAGAAASQDAQGLGLSSRSWGTGQRG